MSDNSRDLVNPQVRFEHTDISATGTVLAGFGVVAGVSLLGLVLYFVFAFLLHRSAVMSPAPLPMEAHGDPLPPPPRIQANPRRDLADQIVYEDSVLKKYQWVNKEQGVVGLPIERAMELIVKRGIPARKAPADLKLFPPETGSRLTGFEGKAQPETQ